MATQHGNRAKLLERIPEPRNAQSPSHLIELTRGLKEGRINGDEKCLPVRTYGHNGFRTELVRIGRRPRGRAFQEARLIPLALRAQQNIRI